MERDESGRFLPRTSGASYPVGGSPATTPRGTTASGTSNPGREAGFAQTSRPWQAASLAGCGDDASRGGGVATTFGLIAGAGIGAALMFLLDPEQGRRRRQHLADVAADALEATTDTVSHAWEAGSEKAVEAGSALYAAAPSRKTVGKRLSSAFGSTRDTASEWLDSAREYLPGQRRRSHGVRDYLPDLHGEVSKSTAGISAAGALVLGLGAMWLFDPTRGRGRRAWVGQKATRVLNETGQFMRATGRHLANKSKGYYHEGRKAAGNAGQSLADSSVAERVRSALGRVGVRESSSIGVQCTGGCVTLTGRCVADDMERVVDTTRSTYGVNHVINEMQPGDPFGGPTNPTTSTSAGI